MLVKRLRRSGRAARHFPSERQLSLMTVGASDLGWRSGVISITTDGITFTRAKRKWTKACVFRLTGCWFGRPVKYHEGRNEILAALRAGGRRHLVKMRMTRYLLADVARALKQIAELPLITAYRRRRPYVHFGPVPVEPAEEDIHGAWTLDLPITLYLTPLHVVLLRAGQVERLIPLEQVQKVTAMRRIDRPKVDGLCCLSDRRETVAFARKLRSAGGAIAEAARRRLEEPLLQKAEGQEG
ncbi:MAG: hypothetical protein U0703_23760 [Anaerolineae bacterium]